MNLNGFMKIGSGWNRRITMIYAWGQGDMQSQPLEWLFLP